MSYQQRNHLNNCLGNDEEDIVVISTEKVMNSVNNVCLSTFMDYGQIKYFKIEKIKFFPCFVFK